MPQLPGFLRRAVHEPTHAALADELARTLALITDERELHQTLAGKLRELLGASHVAVIFASDDIGPYHVVAVRGSENGADTASAHVAPITFARTGPLAQWLRVNEEPFALRDQPELHAYLSSAERDALATLRADLVAPLVVKHRLRGFLALAGVGPSASAMLGPLASHAALALENAALLRDQRTRLGRMYRAERLAAAGELAAGAAHEIRNPLTAIRSTIQLVAKDYPEGTRRREQLDDVLGEVDRINDTLASLLAFARPGEPRRAYFDAGDLARRVVGVVGAQADTSGVHVNLTQCDPVMLHADSDLLRQVLLNLLRNAVQASPAGGVVTMDLDADDRFVHFVVRDQGKGMSSAQVERIFDPFFTTTDGGTGLGLPISLSIVRQHGGDIEVTSVVNQGTTAVVHIPRGRI